MKKKITFDWPILMGSISVAKSRCGKPSCACKAKTPKLHGPYYRWTGFINGKRTTRTISTQQARECKQRLNNFRRLQQKMENLINESLADAPWILRQAQPP